MRSEGEVNIAVERYADMICRICRYHLKNSSDTEDICQNVFLKYLRYDGKFTDENHEKAWFIRVTINSCKDHLKMLFRHRTEPLGVLVDTASHIEPARREVLEAVFALPDKYKDPIYLHYCEGYSAAEIAAIIKSKESTVYSLLSRGRAMLRETLGGEGLDE